MTAPTSFINFDALLDAIRQIVREELAALLAAQPAHAPAHDEPAYFTVEEAAAYLNVEASTIYRAANRGEINKTPIARGREYRISRDALRAYTTRQEGAA